MIGLSNKFKIVYKELELSCEDKEIIFPEFNKIYGCLISPLGLPSGQGSYSLPLNTHNIINLKINNPAAVRHLTKVLVFGI